MGAGRAGKHGRVSFHTLAIWGDDCLENIRFGGIRRPASASPATGSARIHKKDQKYLIAQAFADA